MWRIAALAALLALPCVPHAADFTPYYGKGEVTEGSGGTMKQVDGVEFWTNGTPPRRYVLIGYIEDSRKVTGMIGKSRLKALPSAVAKLAKESGGDAVIEQPHSENATGIASSGTVSIIVMERVSKFAVVRYVE